MSAGLLCDRFGRRPLFLWCMGGMLVTFIAWAICGTLYGINPDNGAAGRAILGLIFIYYFARPLCPSVDLGVR